MHIIKLLFTTTILLVSTQASATEYKCYVTGSDTLKYLVIVDFDTPGMAARAARHVRIKNQKTGRVGVQDVHECVTLDKPFRNKAARLLEEKTPLETITNPRK